MLIALIVVVAMRVQKDTPERPRRLPPEGGHTLQATRTRRQLEQRWLPRLHVQPWPRVTGDYTGGRLGLDAFGSVEQLFNRA